MTKVCTKCKVEKDVGEFYRDKSRKDGLYSRCKACKNQNSKRWRLNNADRHRQYEKKYKKQYMKQYMNTRRAIDSIFKLKDNIRGLITTTLRNHNLPKTSKTTTIVGCSIPLLKNHLDYTFWLNYGRYPTPEDKLHIDHVVPVSKATTEDELLKLNHYSNLQYLLASDNISKSNRYYN